jgi:hypothetical protein
MNHVSLISLKLFNKQSLAVLNNSLPTPLYEEEAGILSASTGLSLGDIEFLNLDLIQQSIEDIESRNETEHRPKGLYALLTGLASRGLIFLDRMNDQMIVVSPDASKDWGHFFGYSQCCIDHFRQSKEERDLKRELSDMFGFVPCPDCRIKTPDDLHTVIRTRRSSTRSIRSASSLSNTGLKEALAMVNFAKD